MVTTLPETNLAPQNFGGWETILSGFGLSSELLLLVLGRAFFLSHEPRFFFGGKRVVFNFRCFFGSVGYGWIQVGFLHFENCWVLGLKLKRLTFWRILVTVTVRQRDDTFLFLTFHCYWDRQAPQHVSFIDAYWYFIHVSWWLVPCMASIFLYVTYQLACFIMCLLHSVLKLKQQTKRHETL